MLSVNDENVTSHIYGAQPHHEGVMPKMNEECKVARKKAPDPPDEGDAAACFPKMKPSSAKSRSHCYFPS